MIRGGGASHAWNKLNQDIGEPYMNPPTNGRAYRDQIRKQDRRKSDTLKEFLFCLQL